ncbi:acyl carrier protein [Halonatronum saccharophilum]|uniref:acyl carrier protein n=1 Tax=Halonatronum saccharophilum TaxID=150060 RepID=UPI00048504F6|nr:acyl carrier protein [Halonatronum saccharophilum]
MNNIFERCKKTIQNTTAGVRGLEITLETKIREDLGIDSLDMVDLVLNLENEFDLIFDESDLNVSSFITIQDLVSLVEDTSKREE